MTERSNYSLLVLNQDWFVAELRALGHQVVYASWLDDHADIKLPAPGSHLQDLLTLLPAEFRPDCLIYHDNSGPAALLGLEDSPFPTIFYSVDAHHHAPWQVHWACAFDRVLVAQKDYLPEFQEHNPASFWFPLWSHERLRTREPKTIDVSFRGNLDARLHPKRAAFFKRLREFVEIDTLTAPYEEIYSVSRIVVNQSVKGDLNFRAFEAMGCGAMLLTPDIANGLRDLFTPDVDIVVYRDGDAEDAAEKIRYYLMHEDERAAIAARGYEKIQRYHSASCRAQELLRHVAATTISPRANKRFGVAVALLTASTICRRHFNALSELLLLASSISLRGSLNDQERVEPSKLCCLGHDCRFRLEQLGLNAKSLELATLLFHRTPDDPINRLALIDALARSDRTQEALTLCRAFPDEPAVVIGHARNAMESLAQQLAAVAASREAP